MWDVLLILKLDGKNINKTYEKEDMVIHIYKKLGINMERRILYLKS